MATKSLLLPFFVGSLHDDRHQSVLNKRDGEKMGRQHPGCDARRRRKKLGEHLFVLCHHFLFRRVGSNDLPFFWQQESVAICKVFCTAKHSNSNPYNRFHSVSAFSFSAVDGNRVRKACFRGVFFGESRTSEIFGDECICCYSS
jgi:hypothetical protein